MPSTATPAWVPAFRAVPRSGFLPARAWAFTPGGPPGLLDRDNDPEGWLAAADADVPVITQWDDGRHTGPGPGHTPTSSASAPSLVASMLAHLDAEPGMRVLEVGTGTGWNAALLAHQLGDDQVVTVEVDPAVAAQARTALRGAGRRVEVITGDGALGAPGHGPFDRIIATAGLRRIPPAWLEQLRPGGLILAPWGTPFCHQDALAKLTAAGDGTAHGTVLGLVEFMKLRDHRTERAPTPPGLPVTDTTTDIWPPAEAWHPFHFAAGLRIPAAAHAVQEHDDGHTHWLYDLAAPGWTAAVNRTSTGPGIWVRRTGERDLWGEFTAAYAWWRGAGRPAVERFGLTVTPGGERVWLDSSEQSV